jgi:hypothetical protein
MKVDTKRKYSCEKIETELHPIDEIKKESPQVVNETDTLSNQVLSQ